MSNYIENAEKFKEIEFTEYYINEINDKIKNDSYLK